MLFVLSHACSLTTIGLFSNFRSLKRQYVEDVFSSLTWFIRYFDNAVCHSFVIGVFRDLVLFIFFLFMLSTVFLYFCQCLTLSQHCMSAALVCCWPSASVLPCWGTLH